MNNLFHRYGGRQPKVSDDLPPQVVLHGPEGVDSRAALLQQQGHGIEELFLGTSGQRWRWAQRTEAGGEVPYEQGGERGGL